METLNFMIVPSTLDKIFPVKFSNRYIWIMIQMYFLQLPLKDILFLKIP